MTDPHTPEPSAEAPAAPAAPARPLWQRLLLWVSGGLAVLVLIVIATLFALRGQSFALPTGWIETVESRVNAGLSPAEVSIDTVDLSIDAKLRPRLTARDVGVFDASGAELGRVNSLRVSLARTELVQGAFLPRQLVLGGAEIVVRRDLDGAIALNFGEDGAGGSFTDVSRTLRAQFAQKPLSALDAVLAENVTVTLEDARSGRRWQATDTRVTLAQETDAITISLASDVFNGTENLFPLGLDISIDKDTGATLLSFGIEDMPAEDFALQSRVLSFLSLFDAPMSGRVDVELDAQGGLTNYDGTLDIGRGRINTEVGGAPVPFGGASGGFAFNPEQNAVKIEALKLASQVVELTGDGQIILPQEGAQNSYVGQFGFDDVTVKAEHLIGRDAQFSRASTSFQLTLEPFALTLGDVTLLSDDFDLHARGAVETTQDGRRASVDLSIPETDFRTLLSYWPESIIPKTRAWMLENVQAGKLRDIDLAWRQEPDALEARYQVDWTFEGVALKALKFQPPIENAAGHGAIVGHKMTVVFDEATISPPEGGEIDIAGSVLQLEDLRIVPAVASIDMQTRSSLRAALSLMSGKPFSVLDNVEFGPDVAAGDAQFAGNIRLPLKDFVPMEELSFAALGTLTDVSSSTLMDGMALSADTLDVSVDKAGLIISGATTLAAHDAHTELDGQWHKRFGAEFNGRSTVSGHIDLDQGMFDVFKITLPEGMVEGSGQGELSVALERGQAPAFTLRSDLSGIALAIDPVGWRLGANETGSLIIEGTAGAAPEIGRIDLEGAGLKATDGALTLDEAGKFARLDVGNVTLGRFLDAPIAIISQGEDAPVRIETKGGRADLRYLPQTSGGASAQVPLDIALDRLQISEGIAVSGLRARLTAGSQITGSFSGNVNGAAPISGTLTRGNHGATITIESDKAGETVAALGILERAEQGDLRVILQARPTDGDYDGQFQLSNTRVLSAPALAELLSALSIIGILDQLVGGEGIGFTTAQGSFTLIDGAVTMRDAFAEGPSLGISLQGTYDGPNETVDMEGVVSPIYFINAIGQIISKRGEGVFGFNYRLTGAPDDLKVSANPLSILVPGALRDLFKAQ